MAFTSWDFADFGAVDAVTGGAGEIARFVGASLPAGVVAAVVAGQAGLVDVDRLQGAELLDVPLRFVVHVRLARPVTAFAAERGRRRAGILCPAVPRMRDVVALGLVAHHAGVHAGVAGGLRRRCLR